MERDTEFATQTHFAPLQNNRTSARSTAFCWVAIAGRLADSYRDVTERPLLIGRPALSLSSMRYVHNYIYFDWLYNILRYIIS